MKKNNPVDKRSLGSSIDSEMNVATAEKTSYSLLIQVVKSWYIRRFNEWL